MTNIKFVEYIYEKKKKISRFSCKKYYALKKKLGHISKKTVFIIGCPLYSNIGDNAILIAEIQFLKNCGISENNIKCISEHDFLDNFELIKLLIKRTNLICGLGGGNMGNQWHTEEQVRRKMLSVFPKNPIIVFPQTIFYQGVNKCKDEEESVKFYNNHSNLTLFAREKESERIMKDLYPNVHIALTPDIVLSTSADDFGIKSEKRSGVLFCTRSDAEKSVDDSVWQELRESITKKGCEIKNTDMYSDCTITPDNRFVCVQKKMQEFADSKLVITDRLHGMIFAAITSTPCIAFGNYNHKVNGTYNWISYLPYIKYVENAEEAKNAIQELISIKKICFSNEPIQPYFEKIKDIIIQIYRQ